MLKRLIDFAVLSENKSECLENIENYSSALGIDVYDLANKEENKYIN